MAFTAWARVPPHRRASILLGLSIRLGRLGLPQFSVGTVSALASVRRYPKLSLAFRCTGSELARTGMDRSRCLDAISKCDRENAARRWWGCFGSCSFCSSALCHLPLPQCMGAWSTAQIPNMQLGKSTLSAPICTTANMKICLTRGIVDDRPPCSQHCCFLLCRCERQSNMSKATSAIRAKQKDLT